MDERIAGVSVEACRNQQEIGIELQKFFQSTLRNIYVLRSWGVRRHRIIIDIRKRFCACSRISRELMNGRERNPRIMRDDRFRAVAVMGIEIPDRDAASAFL